MGHVEFEDLSTGDSRRIDRLRRKEAKTPIDSKSIGAPPATFHYVENRSIQAGGFVVISSDVVTPGGAITERALTNNTTTGTGLNSMSLTPSGDQEADWVVVAAVSVGGNVTHVQSSGGLVSVGQIVSNNTTVLSVWKRKIGAGETGLTFTVDWIASGLTLRGAMACRAYDGGDLTDIVEIANAPQSAVAQALALASVDPAGLGTRHVLVEASNSAAGSFVSFGQPTNYVEKHDIHSAHASNANACLGWAERALPDAAATGTQQFTVDGGVNRSLAGLSLLLQPSSGEVNLQMPVVAHNRNRQGTTMFEDMQDFEAEYGPIPDGANWPWYRGTGDSLTFNADANDIMDHGLPLHVYAKVGLPWSTVTNGSQDSRLVALANSLKSRPAMTFVVNFHHEMEGELNSNGGTAGTHAQYTAMHRYCVDFLEAQNVTNARYAWVITHSANKPNDLLQLWPGNGYVDVVGVQRYIRCNVAADQLAVRWLDDLQWFWDNYVNGTRNWRPKKADGTGDVEFQFTEWGPSVGGNPDPCGVGDRDTTAHRAAGIDSIRDILTQLSEWGVTQMRYFDSQLPGIESNWIQPKPAADALAYQELIDAAAAGGSQGFVMSTVGATV